MPPRRRLRVGCHSRGPRANTRSARDRVLASWPTTTGVGVLAILTSLVLGMASNRLPSRIVMLHDPVDPDLPCPWCMAPTFEQDRNCASCGQNFG